MPAKTPRNHGTSWTPKDQQALQRLAKGNTPTGLIAHQLGRTETRVPQLFTPIVHETWRFCREEASSRARATCIYAQRNSEGLRRLPLRA